jgi:hypothetical protein
MDLPASEGCTPLMIISDRLGIGVILEACPDIKAESVVKIFIRAFYRYYGIPSAIVSDQGR